MNKTKFSFIFIGLYAVLISILYLFRIGGELYFPGVVNILTILTPLLPILLGYLSFRYFGWKTLQGKSTFFILIGIICWLMGDVLWFIVFKEAIISIADAVYFLGYLFLVIGIVFGIRLINPAALFHDKKKLVILGLVTLASVVIFLRLVPLEINYEVSIWENITTVGYTLTDFILISATIIIFASVFYGSYRHAWIMFAFGCVSTFIGDVFYALNYETYTSGDLLDLTWYFGYLFFAMSFILLKHNAEKSMENAKLSVKK
jgi:hypothetical protein